MTIIELRRACQRAPRRPGRGARAGFALAVFVVAGGSPDAPARAAACEGAAPAAVTVEARGGEVREAFDTTGTELQHAALARGVQAHWPALGAYVAEIAYAAEIAEDAQADENGLYCATPSAVHVVISLQGRVIHLARELRGNRCLEEAVRQHERRHAGADDRAFMQMPALSGRLRSALAHLRPARAASATAAKTLLTAAVGAQVNELSNRLDKERARSNRSVDATEAITKLRTFCRKSTAYYDAADHAEFYARM